MAQSILCMETKHFFHSPYFLMYVLFMAKSVIIFKYWIFRNASSTHISFCSLFIQIFENFALDMAIFITQILFRFDPVILPLFFDSMAIVSSCSNARKVLYIGIEVDIYSLRECSFISIYSSHLKYSKRVKEFCLTASQFAVHADDVVLQKKNKVERIKVSILLWTLFDCITVLMS